MATTCETLAGTMRPISSTEKAAATRRMFLAAMLSVTVAALGQVAYYAGSYVGQTYLSV